LSLNIDSKKLSEEQLKTAEQAYKIIAHNYLSSVAAENGISSEIYKLTKIFSKELLFQMK